MGCTLWSFWLAPPSLCGAVCSTEIWYGCCHLLIIVMSSLRARYHTKYDVALFSLQNGAPCPCSDAVLRSTLARIILHRPPSLWFAVVRHCREQGPPARREQGPPAAGGRDREGGGGEIPWGRGGGGVGARDPWSGVCPWSGTGGGGCSWRKRPGVTDQASIVRKPYASHKSYNVAQ